MHSAKQENSFDFQRDLIKTNELLQSLVTDMRYHCEVYKLSLRSINKIIKQLQQEHTTDVGTLATSTPHLKYSARSRTRREVVLVSQTRALEKITSVLRKARTFINGYALLEKAEKAPVATVVIPEPKNKQDADESTRIALPLSTQPVVHSLKKLENKTEVNEVPVDEHKVINDVVRTRTEIPVLMEKFLKPTKSFQIEVDIIQKGSQLRGNESFLTDRDGYSLGSSSEKLCKPFRLDESVSECQGRATFSSSSSIKIERTPKERSASHNISRFKKSRNSTCSSSRVIKQEGRIPETKHIVPGWSPETLESSGVNNPEDLRNFYERSNIFSKHTEQELQNPHSKIETVQTRRITGQNKYQGSWKYNRYHNYNKGQQHNDKEMNSRKLVNNHRSPHKGESAILEPLPQRKHFRHGDSTFDQGYSRHQHQRQQQHRYQGKVRRVDIDPQIKIIGNGKSEQVHHGCVSRYITSDYLNPFEFHENRETEFVRQHNTVMASAVTPIPIRVETPLQNPKITTTLIPHDNNGPVFLEDPRLARKKKMDQLKDTSPKFT